MRSRGEFPKATGAIAAFDVDVDLLDLPGRARSSSAVGSSNF
ncbi:hypothetical protein [Baaleninema simplex]|nr:hypothetical protein [Baaleninema simplex]